MSIREFPEIPSFMKHIATNGQGYLFQHIGPTIELTKPSRKVIRSYLIIMSGFGRKLNQLLGKRNMQRNLDRYHFLWKICLN